MKRKDIILLSKTLQGLDIVADRVKILKMVNDAAPFTTETVFNRAVEIPAGKKPKNRITILYDVSNIVTGVSYG